MYPQGSVVMILMMIRVSHCPSLIISTWYGPLVLSFQVSPSPWANQHYMYNLPCRNIIHYCTFTDGREKNISMAVTAAATAVCYGLLFFCLGKWVFKCIKLLYTRLQSLKSMIFHTHVKHTLCTHNFWPHFYLPIALFLSFLDLMPWCVCKIHNT